jgi:uncharacterized protein (TIGR02284 family)
MPATDAPGPSDAAELQAVLTRYVDSHDGYLQAAEVVESSNLATAFREIAARRKIIVDHVSTLIIKQGEKPDSDGSPEAAIHRWWIRVRATMNDEEFKVTLEECVRGEKELARTIDEALEHGNLEATHAAIVAEVAAELKEALHTFEMVLER